MPSTYINAMCVHWLSSVGRVTQGVQHSNGCYNISMAAGGGATDSAKLEPDYSGDGAACEAGCPTFADQGASLCGEMESWSATEKANALLLSTTANLGGYVGRGSSVGDCGSCFD